MYHARMLAQAPASRPNMMRAVLMHFCQWVEKKSEQGGREQRGRRALLRAALRDVPGTLYLADIGIPPEVYHRVSVSLAVPYAERDWLPLERDTGAIGKWVAPE